MNNEFNGFKPSPIFQSISMGAFIFSNVVFAIGLYNAQLALSEKGFYIAVIVLGLFSVVTVQKSIRDKIEGIEVHKMFFNLGFFAVAVAIGLMIVGLFNAVLPLNEKGFFAVTFVMSLFSSIVLQKNFRDMALFDKINGIKIKDKNEVLKTKEIEKIKKEEESKETLR